MTAGPAGDDAGGEPVARPSGPAGSWTAAGSRARLATWAAAAAAVVVGLGALGLFLFRPLAAAPAGFDTAFSVIYFERLVQGRLLEAFPSTTPKPLITLLAGGLYEIGGWTAVWWATLLALAAGILAAAAFARRFGGPLAAAMVVVGLGGSWLLLLDADLAYATPWALVAWAVAGLAVTADRPRYGLAGLALLAAALCRAETFVLLAAILAWLVLGPVLAHFRLIPAPPRAAFRLLIGWLAVPVMLVHDELLVRDPLFWLKLPRLNAPPNITPRGLVELTLSRSAPEWGLLLFATVGLVYLARDRRWAALAGIIVLGAGNLALLMALALSGTYVSFRYFLPTDVAVTVAGAIGAGALAGALLDLVPRHRSGIALALREVAANRDVAASRPVPVARIAGSAVAIVIGAALAVALVRPFGPLDANTRVAFHRNATFAADLERAMPTLRAQMASLPSPADVYPGPPGWDRLPPPRLAVPGLVWPRATVDLGVPLWYIASQPPVPVDPSAFRIAAPMLVYFDLAVVPDEPRWEPLMVSRPTRVGHVLAEPVIADGAIWVEWLRPAD